MAVWTLGVAGQSELGTTTFLGAAGPADIPSLRVEVSFTAAPGANPVWQDISQYVRSGSIRRGRQRELDKFQAGTCTVVLDNRTRTFDPSYSAGPYFGNIKPVKRMRVYAIYSGVTYPLFDGYVDNWAQNYQKPLEATSTMTATDGFKVLAIQQLTSVYRYVVASDTPARWYRLDEAAGVTTVADSSANAKTAQVYGSPTFGTAALVTNDGGASMTNVDLTTAGVFTDPIDAPITGTTNFTLECWVKFTTVIGDETLLDQSRTDGSIPDLIRFSVIGSDSNKVHFAVVNSTGTVANEIKSTSTISTGTIYHIVATYSPVLKIYINGVDVTDPTPVSGTGTGSGSITAQRFSVAHSLGSPGTTAAAAMSEVAVYTTALSSANITAHYNAGTTPWSGDLSGARITNVLKAIKWVTPQTVSPGATTVQKANFFGTSALAYLQNVELTEAGLLFMAKDGSIVFLDRTARYASPTSLATFGDSGSEIGYVTFAYDVQDQPISNDVHIQAAGGLTQIANDQTSIGDFLIRTLSLTGLLNTDDTQSKRRAQFEVANRKDLLERVTMLEVFPMFSPTTYFPAVLVRELNDSVTVNRRPQGVGSVVSQLSHIEGIQHEFAPRHWKSSFYVSPVSGIATDGTSVSKQYWILGIVGASELGQTTRLGF